MVLQENLKAKDITGQNAKSFIVYAGKDDIKLKDGDIYSWIHMRKIFQ